MRNKMFDILDEMDVEYAVLCSVAFLNNPSNKFGGDWFIAAPASYKNLRKYGFKQSKGSRRYIIEYTMTDEDVKYFKSVSHQYIKVLVNKDGRVYEKKGKSLKEYHHANK